MAKKDYPQIYVEYEREETEQTTSQEVLGGELWFDWLYHINIVNPKKRSLALPMTVFGFIGCPIFPLFMLYFEIKALYLRGKIWYQYQKKYPNMIFERKKYENNK